MQGLGSGAIASPARRRLQGARSCRSVARGDCIAAFALSEPEAGSDVAAMTTAAPRADGERLRAGRRKDLDLERRHRRRLHRLRPHRRGAGRARPLGFRRPADDPGFAIAERIEVIAPHPLARLALRRLPRSRRQACSARPARASRSRCDPRHFPLVRRRGGAGLRAARARRGARACACAPHVRRDASPICS